MSDPSGAKASSLTQGWVCRWAERRRTVCVGRTASVWCHLRRSRQWRRPRAEWWKTSSDGRMWLCPWWTGQRSLHLAGLKSTAWRTLDTIKEAKSSRQMERSVSVFIYTYISMLLTCKHHHVLEIGFDLVASSEIQKKWKRVNVGSSAQEHRHLGRNQVKAKKREGGAYALPFQINSRLPPDG